MDDYQIIHQFGEIGKKKRFMKQVGIDFFILQEINNGNLDKELSKY